MPQETATLPLRRVCLGLALGNIAVAILFSVLLFVVPKFSALSARMRFTELDRAGVINATALQQFHANPGFGDITRLEHRRTVPDYIAAAPLSAEQFNASLGLVVATANALVCLAFWRSSRPMKTSELSLEH